MRHIVEHLVESGQSLGLGSAFRFYVDDQRLQRNLQRVISDPVLTAAALSGVIADHRVVETLSKTNAITRNIVLQLETKLGRKLGRERAQKLMAAYARVQAARLPKAPAKKIRYSPQHLAA